MIKRSCSHLACCAEAARAESVTRGYTSQSQERTIAATGSFPYPILQGSPPKLRTITRELHWWCVCVQECNPVGHVLHVQLADAMCGMTHQLLP
jgi:hypothetical protein